MSSHPSAREFLFENIERILGDNGLAARDGIVASAQQREYARRWCEAICRGVEGQQKDGKAPPSMMLASADTGTGKTIGYGVPLLLRASMGVKVGVATYTHALQTQFLGTPGKKGDLVRIADWLAELGLGNLVIRRRVGRQAFISLSAVESLIARMRQHREEEGLHESDLEELEPLVEFAMNANSGSQFSSGLIDDLIDELGGELPLGIMPSSICLGIDSSPEDSVRYEEHLEQAENADVVIFSHAYLASSAQFRSGRLMDAHIDVMVVDEADRLAEVAASAFRHDLSLRRCAKSLAQIGGSDGGHAAELLNEVATLAHEAHLRKAEKAVALLEMMPSTKNQLVEKVGKAHKAIKTLISKLKSKGGTSGQDLSELTEIEVGLSRFIGAADSNDAGDYGNGFLGAVSYSPIHSLPSISVMPLDQGVIISRLWDMDLEAESEDGNPPCAVLLTSATLGVPGNFAEAKDRFKVIGYELGVRLNGKSRSGRFAQKPELDLWGSFEPEKFGGVRYILADPSLPRPTATQLDEDANAVLNEQWLAYAVKMVSEAKKAGGRTLVLCSSYKDVRTLADLLARSGVKGVVEQVRGMSGSLCQERFLENKESVWISPTAWEGVNLPGAIQNLVILRIPFRGADPTTRALLRAKSRYSGIDVESIMHAIRMNAAKRKLRQGTGRPIRSKDDKARIWIADPRFPLSPASQLPLRHPGALKYANIRRFEGFHAVIPKRFQRALENASVMLENGTVIS